MKTKKPVLKRVRFTYEVLCPVHDARMDDIDIPDVVKLCLNGEWSGRTKGRTTELLDRKQAKLACAGHGTDLESLGIPEFADGTRVWWTDPDEGLSSGWYTITDWNGERYTMTNDAGGECEAFGYELSLKKPRGKK